MVLMVLVALASSMKIVSVGRERVMPEGYCSGIGPVTHVT